MGKLQIKRWEAIPSWETFDIEAFKHFGNMQAEGNGLGKSGSGMGKQQGQKIAAVPSARE
jgi:hypothetical protein